MVANGGVSAAVAVQVVREHGDDAGKVLADAAKNGKGKVTAGTMQGKALPRKVVDEVEEALMWFKSDGLDTEARVAIAQAINGNPAYKDTTVEVRASYLGELLNAAAMIEGVRRQQAERALEAAAKAAQADIEDVA
jgi:hypothetical protein